MLPARPLLLVFASLAAILLPAASASGLSYPVTSTADTDSKGTLRGSIEEANAETGMDTIPITATGTIELATPLPPITGDVAITGPGAGLLTVRRSAADGFRIFDFGPGVTASISGLTVSNGLAASGAGINNDSGSLTLTGVVVTANEAVVTVLGAGAARGGGIHSSGPLTLRESKISENVARESNATLNSAGGGGVSALGPLTIDRSTISGNLATSGAANLSTASGGGLLATGEPVVVERSTISGNTATAAGGAGGTMAIARAGGIQGSEGVSLTGSTVTGNAVISGKSETGANIDLSGTNLVRNTIVANPVGAGSCSAPLTSGGFNLDEDGSCEFGQGSDLVGVDPLLGPLAANSGPTPTHALLAGSIAIDRGNSFGASSDQRGLPRPSNFAAIGDKEGGDGSDIGAFELQAPPSSPILVRAVAGDRAPPNTRIVSGPPRVTFEPLAKFRFASSEAQSRFQCKVDKRRWRGCANPFKRAVSAGFGNGRKHVFKVRAIDRFGNVDPRPARFGWRVKKIAG